MAVMTIYAPNRSLPQPPARKRHYEPVGPVPTTQRLRQMVAQHEREVWDPELEPPAAAEPHHFAVNFGERMRDATQEELQTALARAGWPSAERSFSGRNQSIVDTWYRDRGTEVAHVTKIRTRGKPDAESISVNTAYLEGYGRQTPNSSRQSMEALERRTVGPYADESAARERARRLQNEGAHGVRVDSGRDGATVSYVQRTLVANRGEAVVGVPFFVDFDPRKGAGAMDVVPGYGRAGWEVAQFSTIDKAVKFLKKLPVQSWMPGTRRLAEQLGVAVPAPMKANAASLSDARVRRVLEEAASRSYHPEVRAEIMADRNGRWSKAVQEGWEQTLRMGGIEGYSNAQIDRMLADDVRWAAKAEHRMYANPGHRSPVDESAATELELYIENEDGLSPASTQGMGKAVRENMLKFMRKGTYDRDKAWQGWLHVVELGAKQYAKEFGTARDWAQTFSPATCEAVARSLAESFEAAVAAGEY